jgi:hypothetical protein
MAGLPPDIDRLVTPFLGRVHECPTCQSRTIRHEGADFAPWFMVSEPVVLPNADQGGARGGAPRGQKFVPVVCRACGAAVLLSDARV